MDVLTTRTLNYTDDNGNNREVVLTIFMPFQGEDGDWRVGFAFSPPIQRKIMHLRGVDIIEAFAGCLTIARAYFESTALFGRAHWQGMLDCGLPDFADERPALWRPPDVPPLEANAGNLDVLSTRRLGCPDEGGVERELLLTVFTPLKADGEKWKCGFTFGPPLSSPIRYGVGEDFIEAFLDGLAMARVIFEQMVPEGWVSSGELHDCSDLPYKVGRSFWKDSPGEIPGMPDFSAR